MTTTYLRETTRGALFIVPAEALQEFRANARHLGFTVICSAPTGAGGAGYAVTVR